MKFNKPVATAAVPARAFYDSTLGFVLYVIAMLGGLGLVTTLIEKAAP